MRARKLARENHVKWLRALAAEPEVLAAVADTVSLFLDADPKGRDGVPEGIVRVALVNAAIRLGKDVPRA
jgi:hypothetical protein